MYSNSLKCHSAAVRKCKRAEGLKEMLLHLEPFHVWREVSWFFKQLGCCCGIKHFSCPEGRQHLHALTKGWQVRLPIYSMTYFPIPISHPRLHTRYNHTFTVVSLWYWLMHTSADTHVWMLHQKKRTRNNKDCCFLSREVKMKWGFCWLILPDHNLE